MAPTYARLLVMVSQSRGVCESGEWVCMEESAMLVVTLL